MAVFNSGGATLKLRTTSGKIRLQLLDSEIALHESLVREQVDRLNKRLTEIGFSQAPFPFEVANDPGLARSAGSPPSQSGLARKLAREFGNHLQGRHHRGS